MPMLNQGGIGRHRRFCILRFHRVMIAATTACCLAISSARAAPLNGITQSQSTSSSSFQENSPPRVSPTSKPLPPTLNSPGAGSVFPANPHINVAPPQLSAVGRTLQDHGVYINLLNVSTYSAVTAGGINHGTFFSDWAILGVDFDLTRLLNIRGAAIHFQTNDVSGQGRENEFTGSTYASLSTFSVHDGLELRELTWNQQLFKDRVVLIAGRYNVTGVGFDVTEFNCRFATFLCSTPRGFIADAPGPSVQSSSWMTSILYRPAESFYMKTGVFEEEPFLRFNNHGSWPGPDWGLNYSQGALIPTEIGYKTSFRDDPYPRTYSLGATYDTMKYADAFYNVQQRPLVTAHGTAQLHSGRSTVYAQALQTIWRPTLSQDRGLVVFTFLNFRTTGYGVIQNNYTFGFFDYGPFAARPKDTVAFAVEPVLFDGRTVEEENAVAASRRIPTEASRSETLMELNYGVHIHRGVDFTPYFEYIFHPDQIGLASLRTNLNHAVQVGFKLRVDYNQLLGLPVLLRTRY